MCIRDRPELNILNYRYAPEVTQTELATANIDRQREINTILDRVNKRIQKLQRAAGKTFVSRTRFSQARYNIDPVSVFRVVLANPMTTKDTLKEILDEQAAWGKGQRNQKILSELSN